MKRFFSRSKGKKGEGSKGGGKRGAGDLPDIESLNLDANGNAVTLADFEIKDTVGTGSFGRVHLCRLKTTGTFYAMKKLKKREVVRLKQVDHIMSERRILGQINHPFIVNMHFTFQDETNLYMILEYIIGGELFSHLREAERFSNETARYYAAEIVLALEHLHGMGIVYRDLKPENLLFDRDGHIKITDFGFAKYVEDRTYTLCGTPEYLAPEIIQSKGHNGEVDWWALGILIYEMLAGFPPFFDNNPVCIYEKILAGKIQFPSHFDADAKDIIKRLLANDRSKRLGNLKNGAIDVKAHAWFASVDWEKLARKELRPPLVPKVTSDGDTGNFDEYSEEEEEARPDVVIDQNVFEGF